MASIYHVVMDPSGEPILDARVTLRLIARSDRAEAPGYVDGTQILDVRQTTSEGALEGDPPTPVPGRWRIDDLVGNDDPELVPANTFYLISTTVPGRPTVYESITVPSGSGVHWVGDCLIDPPADLDFDALSAHIASPVDPHAAAGYIKQSVLDAAIASVKVIPAGTTDARPASPDVGAMWADTDLERPFIYF